MWERREEKDLASQSSLSRSLPFLERRPSPNGLVEGGARSRSTMCPAQKASAKATGLGRILGPRGTVHVSTYPLVAAERQRDPRSWSPLRKLERMSWNNGIGGERAIRFSETLKLGRKEARNNLMKEGSDPMCKDGHTDQHGRTADGRNSE